VRIVKKQHFSRSSTRCLTITLELHDVIAQPGSTVRSSLDSIGTVSRLAKSSGFASSRGKSTAFAVLVYRVANPVDARIIADLGVGRINKNNFIVLHSSILVNPVRVEYTKIGELASNLLFSNGLKVTFKFKMVDTLVLWLSEYHTTVNLTLASSTTYSDTNNYISLLSLVSKTVSLIGTAGLGAAYHLGALTVFPCADTEKETEGITLLVTPKLFHILVGSHD
jgi:hypothetical protein